jgi:reactive intermediate/imine deaminase
MSGGPIVTGILTDRAPAPAGHYSQGIVSRGHVFVSGQLPIRPDGQPLAGDGFEAQVRQAIQNMLEVLRAAGSTPQHLVKVTAYIVGIEHWASFNAVYASMLPDARSARTVVPVPELHYGYLVEIDAIAVHEPGSGTQADPTGSIQ